MIAFKDNYDITTEEYSVYVFRKDDIARITYNNEDNTAMVHFKKGTWFFISHIDYATFLSTLKQLEVSLSNL